MSLMFFPQLLQNACVPQLDPQLVILILRPWLPLSRWKTITSAPMWMVAPGTSKVAPNHVTPYQVQTDDAGVCDVSKPNFLHHCVSGQLDAQLHLHIHGHAHISH